MEIAIDFDGTCTTHEFPKIGKDIGAVRVLKRLINNGHNLILFTMRSDRRRNKKHFLGMIDLTEIKKSEGLSLKAYKIANDKVTIGYGNTTYKDGSLVQLGDKITLQQAEDLLRWKVENEFLPPMMKLIKTPITENQKSALLSLVYNCGIGNFKKSQVLKKVNINPSDKTIRDTWKITFINKGTVFEKGLRSRRIRESDLYFTV